MPKTLSYRFFLVVAVVLVAFLFLIPTMGGKVPTWLTSVVPIEEIKLGLDLQGGMHLVLEVDVNEAVNAQVERNSQELRRKMRDAKIRAQRPQADKNGGISVVLLSDKDLGKFEDLAQREFDYYNKESEQAMPGGKLKVTLRMTPEWTAEIGKLASEQALEKIRNRVDDLGVAEPDILPQPGGRILLQLPGLSDPDRAKAIIGKTALLEFKLVDDQAGDPARLTKNTVPPGSELAYLHKRDRTTGRVIKEPIVLRKRTLMTGDTITDARMQFDSQYGEPYVSVAFDARGTRQFGDLTTNNVNKRLAILMDGKVQSAPVIQEPITGGEARITGDFTHEEARDLAVVLRSGALPAPVLILEERTVGPSLGRDSIEQGITSMVVGFVLVVLFIVIYYRMSGLVANLALLLNILLIAAALAAIKATLTLPGIAGVILTIGMAVDANVLIFERVREEIRLGKTPAAAIEAGYGKATLTILDANITTLIAALVLLQFGTGAVKGFAVTLSIGIASSLFTAITVTRMVFDVFLTRYNPKKLSI